MQLNKIYSSADDEDNIHWCTTHVWLDERGREIVEMPGYGLCFLCSLQHTLRIAYGEKYSVEAIMAKILGKVKKDQLSTNNFLKSQQNLRMLLKIWKHSSIRTFL